MAQLIQTTLGECYKYREVLYNLLSRDLKVKYKRTLFGYFWSLLNPILQLTLLSAVFSHIVNLRMKDYTLYLFSGLLGWTFFQSAITMASVSFLENENFIKKIYLPKILFPLSKVLLRGVDFLFSLLALCLLGIFLGFPFKSSWMLLPGAVSLLFIFTVGICLISAVLTVFFRDVQHLMQVFLQLLYFATPIIYPLSALPPRYQQVMQFNPLVSQLVIFQRILYDGHSPSGTEWAVALLVAFMSLTLGLLVLWQFEEELVFRL